MVLWAAILDLLFPPKCIFCGKLLQKQERDVCTNCLYDLPETDRRRPVRFTEGCVAPFFYRGNVREAVLRFKFGNRPDYAAPFGAWMAQRLQNTDAELVTWAPVSPLRRLGRGYDQAQLLAKEVAGRLCLPCSSTLHKRERRRQSRMRSAEERKANIAGAFRIRDPEKVRGKRILLIDDVCTTGATLSEAAMTLGNAGAAVIYCGTLTLSDETKR
ncbi:MAG: phosphoribosyltransferase family protein [Oscillospiraceae bacterium]|nr:phosphoribosyltransferase family protein [Oscillospiraceae bacterium]